MQFQENLKYYREKAGYKTAKDFSKALNISYTTYFAYENQGREPKYKVLCQIANLLNVSLDDLVGRMSKSEDEILELNIKDVLKSHGFLKGVLSGLEKIKIELISVDKNDIHFNFYINDKQINDISLSKQKIINEFNSIDEKSEIDKNLKKKEFIYSALTNKYVNQSANELEENNNSSNDEKLLFYETQLKLYRYLYQNLYSEIFSKMSQEPQKDK